jgi:hypothetical protein
LWNERLELGEFLISSSAEILQAHGSFWTKASALGAFQRAVQCGSGGSEGLQTFAGMPAEKAASSLRAMGLGLPLSSDGSYRQLFLGTK